MKRFLSPVFCLAILLFITSLSEAQRVPKYILDKKIALPGNGKYDYLSIDQGGRRLYVSHGTAVDVINLETEKLIGTVGHMKGIHGIAVVREVERGFVSDGKANAVVVFDLNTLKTIATIPLSGKKPDAIIYDPFSKHVFAFDGGSDNASVIDVNTLREIAVIPLGGGPEFAVSDDHGKIYNNLEDKNSLNVIDTRSLKVIKRYPLAPCGGPTGLALDAVHQRLFTVCRQNKGMTVLDTKTGKIIATLPIGSGVDAVAYDPETQLIFCSNADATVTIIKQESPDSYAVVQTLPTQRRAKTMALDYETHKIYLSVADIKRGTQKTPIPGSFKVLVYQMKR